MLFAIRTIQERTGKDLGATFLSGTTISMHGGIIPVSVPPEVPLREFPYNAVVELVNPVADTVSRKTYTGADVDWYVKAEDIVLKNKGNQNVGSPQNHTPQGQPKK